MDKKPHIDSLFDVMNQFRIDTRNAGFKPEKWVEARERFKAALRDLGIADSFDWTEE